MNQLLYKKDIFSFSNYLILFEGLNIHNAWKLEKKRGKELFLNVYSIFNLLLISLAPD